MSRMLHNEGADITGADMDIPQEQSKIVEFYTNKTIFLTGATGFIGQLVLEKLLRTCPDLHKLYITVRNKKNKDPNTRIKEIFQEPTFDVLRRKNPKFMTKIHIIPCDLMVPGLEISTDDKKLLIEEVECLIHCAATVRFDEKLRKAANTNVRPVIELVSMAKQMKKLEGMVYVSTAYSNCNRYDINETFYEPAMQPETLLKLLDCVNDDTLETITPRLIGDFPNTYTFSKSIAEHVIKTSAKNLPISICRPSIIVSTAKEPLVGWINNVYGPTGAAAGCSVGLIHAINGKRSNEADLIPADFVVNCILAILYKTAQLKNVEHVIDNNNNNNPLIYNCVTSVESPITWGTFMDLCHKQKFYVPTTFMIWYPFTFMIPSRKVYDFAILILHTIPAYIFDFVAVCLGKKPQLVEGYRKINKFLDVIAYFTSNKWKFTNNNVQKLWKEMNIRDQELFEFGMKDFDWKTYIRNYIRGGRTYLLKDPLDTVPQAKRKFMFLIVANYSLLIIALYLFIRLVLYIF